MNKETLRMQMLAGLITESEYKVKLEENLWDRIKNTPKVWLAKIKGGFPAIMVKSLEDAGLKVGKPIYYNHAGFLHKVELKSIDYNTGAVDITYEKSNDGGKSWKVDDAEGLSQKLDLEQDLSKLQNMDEKELQNWYNKSVKTTKKQFQRKDIAYDPKDLAEPTSLNEHYVAGGIVGIGAINQIPSRAKTDYEDAFEHFLGQKYSLNEMEDDVEEGNLGHNEMYSIEPEGRFWIVTYTNMDGKQEKVFQSEDEAREFASTLEEGKKVEESSLYEANPLEGGPGYMTKYRVGVLSALIADAEKDLIKYEEEGLLSPELTEKMKGTIEKLKSSREALKAQYREETGKDV
jgi:hypothetical protein